MTRPRKILYFSLGFSLKIFKLQAQIVCNEMNMSNDEVQEYQVELLFFPLISNKQMCCCFFPT